MAQLVTPDFDQPSTAVAYFSKPQITKPPYHNRKELLDSWHVACNHRPLAPATLTAALR